MHVCETAKGGVGSYINLFASFDAAEISSTVVAPYEHSDHIDSQHDLVTFSYPKRGIGSLYRMVRTALRTIRRTDPDVIYCHSTFSLLMVVVLRLSFERRPVIFCAHGWAMSMYDHSRWKQRIVRMIEGTCSGLASVVINISAAERDLARKLGYFGKHVLLENAVPDARPDARSDRFGQGKDARDTQIELLFVGRLDRQKGLDVLMEAFRRVEGKRNDIRLHVVGASVNKDSDLQALPSGIEMHGWVDKSKIDDWYRSADALIVPSRWEGFGLVVAEAFRNGTPALVSDRGGLPSLVSPGETGQVFALSAEAVAETLLNLDLEALHSMRPKCRDSYDTRFTLNRFKREFLAIVGDLMSPKRRQLVEEVQS